jgi:trehalose 6-phosphate synthase
MADTQVLVASNRGPVSFSLADDGALSMRRGGGGLVSALAGLRGDILWICATLSDADRAAARRTEDGRLDVPDIGAVRMLDIPAGTFHRAYNAVANSTLWFVHHMLYDIPNKPHFDARSRRDWQSYEAYNAAFADALAQDAVDGAKIAVQDYHLALVPTMLRERRPDVKIVHFSHTPWAPPEYYRLLPDDIGRQVLEGILGADHAGF